jgi:hypothetical protein
MAWASSATRRRTRLAQLNLCQKIVDWVKFEDDFDSLREAAFEFSGDCVLTNVERKELTAIARLLGSVGAFTSSQILVERAARYAFSRQPTDHRDAREFLQAALYLGEFSQDLLSRNVHLLNNTKDLETFALYQSFMEKTRVGPFTSIFYGPGPTSVGQGIHFEGLSIARILMPGVSTWEDPDDQANGQTDLLYANGQTTAWLRTLDRSSLAETLGPATHLKLKSGQKWPFTSLNISTCLDIRALYFCGNPNMGPNAVLDLLSTSEATRVYVTGTNFYQSTEGYRPNSRRYFLSTGEPSDQYGSTGRPFERCWSMASHDQPNNRVILSNLLKGGSISGDDPFLTAVTKAMSDFTGQLERNYGAFRR